MPLTALVDCANFYCSCERVFAPALERVPVAVLSNNDGCIIARSEEVKAMGIPMGAPYFKHKDRLKKQGVRVFSSNYALYADMSRRVMDVLHRFSPEVEVYSIDEAFVHLPHQSPEALAETARALRQRVLQWTGIPVRVGLGPTKTLAKVANKLAKRTPDGVFSTVDHTDLDALLDTVPVGDIWGVGPAYRRRLEQEGVRTARALRDLPDVWVRRHLTVVGLRTVWELRGISCLPLELLPPTRKGITRSRSFGEPVEALGGLQEAVACYISRAAEKLRTFDLDAMVLQVFIMTNRFAHGPKYANAATVRLPCATNYTPELLKAALACLDRIYRPGYAYKKAGVTLSGLVSHTPMQGHLFLQRDPRADALMHAVDRLNGRRGRHVVFLARCGVQRPWSTRRAHTSPHYTTRWDELPEVTGI